METSWQEEKTRKTGKENVMIRIGVIGDDHIDKQLESGDKDPIGSLRAKLQVPFANVSTILHTGDSTEAALLEMLGKFGTVYAVRGNMDPEPFNNRLSHRLTLIFQGIRFGLIHGYGNQEDTARKHAIETFQFDPCDCIVFGHTHRPFNDYEENRLVFNPGATTTAHYNKTKNPTVGILTIIDRKVSGQIIDLETGKVIR